MTGGPTGSRRTLADRLNHLFAAVIPAERNGKPYTNHDVATGIRAQGGDISSSYLGELRNGNRTNPGLRHIEELARFFNVAPAYFFDDSATDQIADELAELRALRELQDALADDAVRVLALKARGLSADGI